MAFPLAGFLDQFDRVNGSLGANYSVLWSGETVPEVISNQMGSTAGTWRSGYWNPTTFADTEAYVTVPVFSGRFYLSVRLGNVGGTSVTGYAIAVASNGTDLMLSRITAGTDNILINYGPGLIASGDSIGISAIGSTIQGWRLPSGGSWTSLGSTTDATYSSGYIGFEFNNTTIRFDNLGGGTTPPVPAAPPDGIYRYAKVRSPKP